MGSEAKQERLCVSCCDGMTVATKIASAPLTTGGTRDFPVCEGHAQMAMVAGWFPIRDAHPTPGDSPCK